MSTLPYSNMKPQLDAAQAEEQGWYAAKPEVLPQTRYVLYYPLALIAGGLLSLIFPTDAMTAVTSLIGTAVGVMLLWRFMFIDKSIRLTRVAAMGLVLGYAGGTLNSWITLKRAGQPLAAMTYVTVPVLARGIGIAVLACGVLLVVGELLEKPVLTVSSRLMVLTPAMKKILIVSAFAVGAALVTGRFTMGGIELQSPGRAGILMVVLGTVLEGVVILLPVAFLLADNSKDRWMLGIAMLVVWTVEFTQGRRALFYPPVIIIPLARYAGYSWKKNTLRKVFIVAIVAVVVFLAVIGYQMVRVAKSYAKSKTESAQLAVAEGWIEQGKAWQIATQSSKGNLESRTLVVTWLGDIYRLSGIYPTGHGRDILIQFEEDVIPSIIDPNKPTIQEEDYASELFERHYPDQANSIFTAGIIDFGLLGILTYPTLALLLLSWYIHFARRYFRPEIYLVCLAQVLLIAIATEQDAGTYLGVIRNTLVCAAFYYLLIKIPLPAFQLFRRREA